MTALLIARNTFREATRDRVLAGVTIGGLVLLLATRALSPLALGEGVRLTVDLGLTTVSMLGLLVVLLVGTSLVAKEIERRTIYNLLSRPIARSAYLVGKWAGLSGALWLVSAALGLGLWLILRTYGGADRLVPLIQATYLAALELTVITAIAVLFSSLSTPVLSALYTLGLFLVGQWSYDLRELSHRYAPPLSSLLAGVANVAPNLPLFNVRSLAAAGVATSWEHLALATGYALVYAACALCLAAAAFESRDFK